MSFKKGCFPIALIFLAVLLSGCGSFTDGKAIRQGKKILGKRNVEIEELVKVRGSLKRVIENKIKAVRLLESTNRLLGRKYLEIGSYNLALEAFAEAEMLMPYNAFIKRDLGECYYFLGLSVVNENEKGKFFARSKQYYEKALEINADLLEARYGLGILLFFGFDDTSGAIDEMKRILGKEPNNIEAHFALGRFYYETGELGKSLGEYITLTKMLPKNSPKMRKAEDNILRINREMGINE